MMSGSKEILPLTMIAGHNIFLAYYDNLMMLQVSLNASMQDL